MAGSGKPLKTMGSIGTMHLSLRATFIGEHLVDGEQGWSKLAHRRPAVFRKGKVNKSAQDQLLGASCVRLVFAQSLFQTPPNSHGSLSPAFSLLEKVSPSF